MSKIILAIVVLLGIVCLVAGIFSGMALGDAINQPHSPKPESTKESSMPTLPADNLVRLTQLEWTVQHMFALHDLLDKEQDPERAADLTHSLDETLSAMRALLTPVVERKYPESVAEQIVRTRLVVMTQTLQPGETIYYPPSVYVDGPRGSQEIVETGRILESLGFHHTQELNRWMKE